MEFCPHTFGQQLYPLVFVILNPWHIDENLAIWAGEW